MNINLDIGWRVGLISIVAYCWPIRLQRNIFQSAGHSQFFPIMDHIMIHGMVQTTEAYSREISHLWVVGLCWRIRRPGWSIHCRWAPKCWRCGDELRKWKCNASKIVLLASCTTWLGELCGRVGVLVKWGAVQDITGVSSMNGSPSLSWGTSWGGT